MATPKRTSAAPVSLRDVRRAAEIVAASARDVELHASLHRDPSTRGNSPVGWARLVSRSTARRGWAFPADLVACARTSNNAVCPQTWHGPTDPRSCLPRPPGGRRPRISATRARASPSSSSAPGGGFSAIVGSKMIRSRSLRYLKRPNGTDPHQQSTASCRALQLERPDHHDRRHRLPCARAAGS
jgi:hypothetical protein